MSDLHRQALHAASHQVHYSQEAVPQYDGPADERPVDDASIPQEPETIDAVSSSVAIVAEQLPAHTAPQNSIANTGDTVPSPLVIIRPYLASPPQQAEDDSRPRGSPLAPSAVGQLSPSTAAQNPASSSGDGPPFGIYPFPPPPNSILLRSPLSIHRGPASSVASSPLSHFARPGLNPLAPTFQPSAAWYLQRGQPANARDPMDEPILPIDGPPAPQVDAVERRVRDAIRHAAMVYRRLTATHRDEWVNWANDLRADFLRAFTGQHQAVYEAEEMRAIMEEPDDPPTPEESKGENDSQLG